MIHPSTTTSLKPFVFRGLLAKYGVTVLDGIGFLPYCQITLPVLAIVGGTSRNIVVARVVAVREFGLDPRHALGLVYFATHFKQIQWETFKADADKIRR